MFLLLLHVVQKNCYNLKKLEITIFSLFLIILWLWSTQSACYFWHNNYKQLVLAYLLQMRKGKYVNILKCVKPFRFPFSTNIPNLHIFRVQLDITQKFNMTLFCFNLFFSKLLPIWNWCSSRSEDFATQPCSDQLVCHQVLF